MMIKQPGLLSDERNKLFNTSIRLKKKCYRNGEYEKLCGGDINLSALFYLVITEAKHFPKDELRCVSAFYLLEKFSLKPELLEKWTRFIFNEFFKEG